ncbi:hypothetical protein VNI00_000853 [Paramarasmius palmivorus]|uniref:Homeobox domain-containing protein n=1 Tax=Paramarasmius palmivorus TaxID=297713 RepID=A0AAW0EC69_9AGAR
MSSIPTLQGIPKVNILELEFIWELDHRIPSLRSRRDWALARNLDPQNVHRWFWRKRSYARSKGIDVPPESEIYDLEIGVPPVIEPEKPMVIKSEELPVSLASPKMTAQPSSHTDERSSRLAPNLRRSRRLARLLRDDDYQSSSSDIDSLFPFSSPTSSRTSPFSSPRTPCPNLPESCAYTPLKTPDTFYYSSTLSSRIKVDEFSLPKHCGLSLPDDVKTAASTRQKNSVLVCSGNSGTHGENHWMCNLCRPEVSGMCSFPVAQPTSHDMTESAPLLLQPFSSDTYDSTSSHASPDTPGNSTPEGAAHNLILDPALARWELSAIPFESRSNDYIPPYTHQHVTHPYLACSARIEHAPSSRNFVFCGFNFSSDGFYICPHQPTLAPCQTCYDALYDIPMPLLPTMDDPELQDLLPSTNFLLKAQTDDIIPKEEASDAMDLILDLEARLTVWERVLGIQRLTD